MSLFGTMRTSISGMRAQADRLSTVSDNIANAGTTGYKKASTEFSTLIPISAETQYTSGSVQTTVRRTISEQGALTYTQSITDLAVQGDGFFLVQGTSDEAFLTRAGSFVLNGDGEMVNAAGFKLLGYPVGGDGEPGVANGTAGLEQINFGTLALQANPSTTGSLSANFPADADIVAAANLPSTNGVASEFSAKTSMVAFANLGREVTLDIFVSKTAAEEWEVTVYDRAAAGPAGFPYTAGPLATTTLDFDPATGGLVDPTTGFLDVPVPDGATLSIDMSESSQLASDFLIHEATVVNGNTASGVDRMEITPEGDLYAVYDNGARVKSYSIPLATVVSPDNLQAISGNIFAADANSGQIRVGQPGSAGLGGIVSGALEQSTVDIASELTSMIETQRNYTANSKVFQTGAELTDVVVNLVR
ncbi:MAG: flagellar hook protein FlgE [Hyphomicrobiaceae bacterium]